MRRRLAVIGLVVLASCAAHPVDLSVQAPATLGAEPPGYETARVTRVVDGDTIVVVVLNRIDGPGGGAAAVGEEHRVRLIGIDTPESVKPGSPVECFAREASSAADAFLSGRRVRLVKDVEETDRFGRLLRYVYVGAEMANARLVGNGYAYAYTYPLNVRHADLFVALQREARENDRGLWSPEACAGER